MQVEKQEDRRDIMEFAYRCIAMLQDLQSDLVNKPSLRLAEMPAMSQLTRLLYSTDRRRLTSAAAHLRNMAEGEETNMPQPQPRSQADQCNWEWQVKAAEAFDQIAAVLATMQDTQHESEGEIVEDEIEIEVPHGMTEDEAAGNLVKDLSWSLLQEALEARK